MGVSLPGKAFMLEGRGISRMDSGSRLQSKGGGGRRQCLLVTASWGRRWKRARKVEAGRTAASMADPPSTSGVPTRFLRSGRRD